MSQPQEQPLSARFSRAEKRAVAFCAGKMGLARSAMMRRAVLEFIAANGVLLDVHGQSLPTPRENAPRKLSAQFPQMKETRMDTGLNETIRVLKNMDESREVIRASHRNFDD